MSRDKSRKTQLQEFLKTCGLHDAQSSIVAGDASFRRYDRLKQGDKSYILMDAPPPEEDCLPFVVLSHYLEQCGFTAPRVLEQDLSQGFLLLEDLGDDTFNRVFSKSTDNEAQLYKGSIDVLSALHAHEVPSSLMDRQGNNHPLCHFNEELFHRELDLFTHWYLPALKKNSNPIGVEDLKEFWQPLQHHVKAENPVMVLRDYHADNLMWLPNRKGIEQIGLLDFQDAVLGHPAYDMVSLLMDARRNVSPQLMDDMINHYLGERADHSNAIDKQEFLAAFHILGAQRNLKIIGIFSRLWKRDKKPHYPTMIPHVWGLLERNLEHPALAPMKAWLDGMVSKEERHFILSKKDLAHEQ